ncbi:MAG: outer membrane lipoprotein-sorting protein [Bacteroidetes bacterium]|nr:outer membrane lipoprotein-sorting protein [Bacteroidota bacterium]MCL2302988.1 outer membrane lipoprotein-sorting protein [Lentimicrobiaceae bacterium]
MKKLKFILSVFILLVVVGAQNFEPLQAQTLTATEIIKRSDDNRRGKNSYSEITMTIVRPTWTREIGIKAWSMGTDFSLTLITAPARDRGQAFLKRGRDLWNWQPSINRMIRMSSSIMGQSWMGSDFTNDDLMRESSTVNDYTHRLVGTEKVREFDCYKLILTPKENAAVVWGKVITWISIKDFVEIKSEFYDEDDELVNTINGYDIKSYGNRRLASRMEVVPADRPNQKTVMTVVKFEFDIAIDESFFSQQNMKRVK